MENIHLEKKYILEYVRDMISDFQIKQIRVNDSRYHHNTSYSDAPSVVKYGVCSLKELNNLGIKIYSSEFLKTMDDTESHINGNDAVSLSVVGLKDLYPGEEEYNPFYPSVVDFLISSDIKTSRNTIHYGNEFLSFDSINPKYFRAIDIRILQLIQQRYKKESDIDNLLINMVDNYNSLIEIATELKKSQLNIALREMSGNNEIGLDVDKISNTKKLVLK